MREREALEDGREEREETEVEKREEGERDMEGIKI